MKPKMNPTFSNTFGKQETIFHQALMAMPIK